MVPTDVFLAAAGIAPNAEIARDAGLDIARGVLVDERMRTSDPEILAAGDVAEFSGRVHGLWPVAVEQAEVAADNAVGGKKEYRGSVPVTMLKVVGIELTSIGRFEAEPGDEVIAMEESGGRYRKLVISDGRVVGRHPARLLPRGGARPHRDLPRLLRGPGPAGAARRPLGGAGRAQRGAAAAGGGAHRRGLTAAVVGRTTVDRIADLFASGPSRRCGRAVTRSGADAQAVPSTDQRFSSSSEQELMQ